MEPQVTFVIPSCGRGTLLRTMDSLYRQSNSNWRAIIVLDGLPPDSFPSLQDLRVQVLSCDKCGEANHGGLPRNQGIKRVQTPFVAFVDDDDTLAETYVEMIGVELLRDPFLDGIVFRMKCGDSFLPEWDQKQLLPGHVGISFCLRTRLFQEEGFIFQPGGGEDYNLLDGLRRARKRIVFSPFVGYFVRSSPDNYRHLLNGGEPADLLIEPSLGSWPWYGDETITFLKDGRGHWSHLNTPAFTWKRDGDLIKGLTPKGWAYTIELHDERTATIWEAQLPPRCVQKLIPPPEANPHL